MEDHKKSIVESLVESFDIDDLNYTENTLKDAYKAEIDRKDKILSSMTVVTAPITILFAGVAFLTNSLLDSNQHYMTNNPDLFVVFFYIVISFLLYFLLSILYNFHRLLAGENYYYIPYGDDLLESIAENKSYSVSMGSTAVGEAARYSKIDSIMQLSESSTRNGMANDIRLKHRQRIFRSTMLAIICTALGFLVVSVHRQQPDTWHVFSFRGTTNGYPPKTNQQSTSNSTTASTPVQTTSDTTKSASSPTSPTPPTTPSNQ